MYNTYELNFELYSERAGKKAQLALFPLMIRLFGTDTIWMRTPDNNRYICRLVTKLEEDKVLGAAHALSEILFQDCVAIAKVAWSDTIRDDIEQGWLIGPYAEEWGEFDPAYFERFTN